MLSAAAFADAFRHFSAPAYMAYQLPAATLPLDTPLYYRFFAMAADMPRYADDAAYYATDAELILSAMIC